MWGRQMKWFVYALLLATAFSFRFCVARFLPNDNPEDGRDYAQMARNLLEQHVYSRADKPPYEPTLIRLPGYSIFLAAIYSVFGHYNNTAVRIVNALIDTASCALVALLAFYWEPDEKRKRTAAIIALALAVLCPFTSIYVATILTEVPTIFFGLSLCLLATFAFRASTLRQSLGWWCAAGLLAGIAVFFRPDSGLFAAAIGLTLVITGLFGRGTSSKDRSRLRVLWRRAPPVFAQGALLSVAFVLVLVPWTIRNWRVFHLFQPLAPMHAAMPGEFVPRGYQAWLKTWVDDQRYIDPVIWSLGAARITLDDIPDSAFDSAEEKKRVGRLLHRYNHPPQAAAESPDENSAPDQSEPAASSEQTNRATPASMPPPSPTPPAGDQGDQPGDEDEGDDEDDDQDSENKTEAHHPVEMTPEIDAGFAQIARERTARAPLRCYFWVPFKRGISLWFDTHSEYYPFEGELFPLSDLDHTTHQHIWLPLFAGLVWIYTLLGAGGGWVLWRSRDSAARRWLLLIALLIFPRVAFFSTIENPEPRYMVEMFPSLAVLGGIALARLRRRSIDETKTAPFARPSA
jgi:4-amino-4-deoxy-L-arabinose transferase-like glycosyltransferase